MYVRNQYRVNECRSSFQDVRQPGASISIRLGTCGMIRTEQSNPDGVNYKVEVVVSPHPIFETRNDEAYSIDCFYKNEQISVNSNLEVNDNNGYQNPPESVVKGIVENNCEYTIRVDSVGGPLVKYAEVGQSIVHRWSCDNSEYLEDQPVSLLL